MMVWIFVIMITVGSHPIDTAPKAMYAMTTREACEWAIKGIEGARCVPLKVIDATAADIAATDRKLEQKK